MKSYGFHDFFGCEEEVKEGTVMGFDQESLIL